MESAPQALRRFLPRAAALVATLLATSLLLRCGSDKDEKKTNQPTPSSVPTSWDGQSDWNQSAWKAVDE